MILDYLYGGLQQLMQYKYSKIQKNYYNNFGILNIIKPFKQYAH